jgi:hypothetical protein
VQVRFQPRSTAKTLQLAFRFQTIPAATGTDTSIAGQDLLAQVSRIGA